MSIPLFKINCDHHLLSVSHVAVPPRITSHPQKIRNAAPGKPVVFTVQATGSDPLSYQWWWRPPEGEVGNEEWQQCDMALHGGASLTIVSVQKSNEGNYHCVVSNTAGSQTSKSAKLTIGKQLDVSGLL